MPHSQGLAMPGVRTNFKCPQLEAAIHCILHQCQPCGTKLTLPCKAIVPNDVLLRFAYLLAIKGYELC